jgi:hypothetical protein
MLNDEVSLWFLVSLLGRDETFELGTLNFLWRVQVMDQTLRSLSKVNLRALLIFNLKSLFYRVNMI